MKYIITLILVISITEQLSAQHDNIIISLNNYSEKNNKINPVQKKSPKEKDFSFTVNPYLWALGMGGSVQLQSVPQPYYFDLRFTDAVSHLKMFAMIAGRFKYKSVSLLYEAVYSKMKPDLYVPVYTGYISGTDEIEQFTGDFSLAYRIPINDRNIQIDIYGGARVWSTSNKLDLNAPDGSIFSGESDNSWTDPIIGLSGNFMLSDRWFSYLKGDIGGFTVSSDWTSSVLFGFGYKFSQNWNTSFGFKRLYIDYDKDKFFWNITEYGLLISLGYQF